MASPAFQNLEKQIGKQIRFFGTKKGAFEKKLGRQFRFLEIKKEAFEKRIERLTTREA